MDIFDSATPQMKRARNQRKDTSVLQSMIANSNQITATEVVFTADGEFRNTRDIFGPPSCETSPAAHSTRGKRGGDDSDWDEDETPKKRKTRRVALSDVSVNAPRLRAPRARKFARSPVKRSMPTRGQPKRERTYTRSPAMKHMSAFGSNRYESDKEEEMRMTAGEANKKKTFGVFKDAPEISPNGTESPLEEPT